MYHFSLPRFSQGILPDLFALNVIAIANAQNAGSRWSDAVETLHVVSRMSLEPTAQTLSPVMSACSQASASQTPGGWKKARVMVYTIITMRKKDNNRYNNNINNNNNNDDTIL